MKPIDVKNISFAEYNEESNEKDSKFKVGGQSIRMSLLRDMLLTGLKRFLL